jgi:glyoxylase-like metal-dependent hydrolase (beta-lactamase superfamily II)
MSIHSWLVETPQYRLLIDTASGNAKDRPFSSLFHQLHSPWLEKLTSTGVHPCDIDYVLHTHLHVDHVGWNTVWSGERWIPAFVNAVHVCSQAEMDFYDSPASASRAMVFEDSIRPVRDAGQLNVIGNHGIEILPGIRFHPTPGHSPGHMSITVESDNQIALFCGDVMHSPLQVISPGWNSMFCGEQSAACDRENGYCSTLVLVVQPYSPATSPSPPLVALPRLPGNTLGNLSNCQNGRCTCKPLEKQQQYLLKPNSSR